jgi:hypothetical protein
MEDLPTIAPGDSAHDWYLATIYLGNGKPFRVLLVRRGEKLYAAMTKKALRRGEFNLELFRTEPGGLMSWLLAADWHRISGATRTPPW